VKSALAAAALLALTMALLESAAATEAMRSASIDLAEGGKAQPDHAALAEVYEQEAEALDVKADQHKELVKTYVKLGYLKNKPELVSHCDSLADEYRAAATESRNLAQLHRTLGSAGHTR
jgi:hypothetical protein